jgi:hypothetical protein
MKRWDRCDQCGRFIPLEDFTTGRALRVLVTPDAYGAVETWETLCRDHNPDPTAATTGGDKSV